MDLVQRLATLDEAVEEFDGAMRELATLATHRLPAGLPIHSRLGETANDVTSFAPSFRDAHTDAVLKLDAATQRICRAVRLRV
jgi:hypothetical protein